jgi:chromosome segregation ATPase
MDKYAEEVASVAKGQQTIAEALKELEVVKEAFLRSTRIESKILDHEKEISEIKSKMQLLSTYSYVNSKNSEFHSCIETIVKNKLDEFTFQMMFEMSKKVNEGDIKKLLETKVAVPDFLALKNLLSSTKLRLDTYLDIEAPSLKNKFNESLANLSSDSSKFADINHQMKNLNQNYDKLEKEMKEINSKIAQVPKVVKEVEHFNHKKIIEMKAQENNSGTGSKLLYDKIDDIEKNISNIFNENLSSKTKFLYLEEIIKSIIKQLEKLGNEQIRLEKCIKDQESHFIECLRLNDMQNQLKNDRVKVEKLPGDEVKKLHKEINEKNKRIVIIENNLKHFITEVEFLKGLNKNIKTKLQEVEKEKKNQGMEVMSLKQDFEAFEFSVSESLMKVGEGYSPKRGMDEEKRLKRNWDGIKIATSEDFYKPMTPSIGKRSLTRGLERPINFSPRVNRYK